MRARRTDHCNLCAQTFEHANISRLLMRQIHLFRSSLAIRYDSHSQTLMQLDRYCHDQAPLSDSLLPLTATCGGLFTSCHRLPHVGEQSVLIHSTVCSISLAPVTHFPSPIYSGLCPLSVSVCHLWFVLPVVEDLLSFICILCPGSPGEE